MVCPPRLWRVLALWLRPESSILVVMQGEIRERWQKLCEQAAEEQDHDKLMKLIEEINYLLEAKEQRLSGLVQEVKKQSAA
jgi:hypothetical protein